MNEKKIYLAGGCFWGLEAYFKRIKGILKATSGYANGPTENPTYEEVCHSSGHAETVEVIYDSHIISLSHIIQYFLRVADPYSKNNLINTHLPPLDKWQLPSAEHLILMNHDSHDIGIQYRTGIYYVDDEDLPTIRHILALTQATYQDMPFTLELLPLQNFFKAEDYHLDYLDKNPGGYCHINLHVANEPLIDICNYSKKSDSELRESLSKLEYDVTQKSATERPFTHPFTDLTDGGIYVDITTGEPLFISTTKFHSGCGWPSFFKPINSDVIRYYNDVGHGMNRTEVRSRIGDAHLGHVFPDGPMENGGLRYCINGAALRFISLDAMDDEGYGELVEFVRVQLGSK